MRASNKSPDDDQLSLFSMVCASGQFAPHVHPEEALAVKYSCAGRGRLNVVSCKDEGIDDDLAAVGGLDMVDAKLRGSSLALDTSVPIVPREMFTMPAHKVPLPVVGVRLNDILTKRLRYSFGQLVLSDDTRINPDVLKSSVFEGKKVILFSSGPDTLIEKLWWRRDDIQLFETIASMGFLAVTGMNFSVFAGECPFGHALNIKKSLKYCQNLDGFGVWTIPHVYAINPHQRERWRVWLLDNPDVKLITINSQLQRSQNAVGEVVKTVNLLLEETGVDILLQGRTQRILSGVEKHNMGRLLGATSGAFKLAMITKQAAIQPAKFKRRVAKPAFRARRIITTSSVVLSPRQFK